MKKHRRTFSVPGISLLVLIFLSLCLITFSLLSLSGSFADRTLSEKAADRTKIYYQASNAANELLAAVDARLAEYLKQAENTSDPESAYLELCSGLPLLIPDSTLQENNFSFSVPVTDDQLLQVSIDLTYPDASAGSLYRITMWKVVNTADWQPDTTQNLFTFE